MRLIWPVFAVLGFIAKMVHKIFLGWWLDPLLQTRANEALWNDIQANLYWLSAEGQRVEQRIAEILPFDYASVCIDRGNIRFWITRGRGELNVSLAPRHLPQETTELPAVIAALESTDLEEQRPIEGFSDVAEVLRSRMVALNGVFSEQGYRAFREKLLKQKASKHLLIRQAEWELRRRLYS